jgi:mannose-6-phosphate isomerase-like protein (cupin superfamily)
VSKVQTKETVIRGQKLWEHLIDCSYFEATKFQTDDYVHLKIDRRPPQRFQLWVFLEGEGTIDWSSHPHDFSRVNCGRIAYKPGECWFIPAAFGSRGYEVKGRTSVLMATPHNPKLFSHKGSDAI